MQKRSGAKGQAAIEFIVVVLVIFFFLFFFLSLSIALVVSDYIEYATFMAARTYKSGFSNQAFQQQYATEVFNTYFEKVQGIARNPQLRFVQTDPIDPGTDDGSFQRMGAQSAGLDVRYDIDLFYLPPIFVTNNGPISRIELQAEAQLGRDPGILECRAYFDKLANDLGFGISGIRALVNQMEDNGC